MSGGHVTYFHGWGSSAVDMSGGDFYYLYTYDFSGVDVSGGYVYQLYPYDISTVNISGGTVHDLRAYNSITANISGGIVYNLFYHDFSTANISGGSLGVGSLYAYDSSVITFYGQNFHVGGGLVLDGDRVLGTGTLSGEWMDGTPWGVGIAYNDPTATILTVIPAPGALILGGIGVGFVGWLRRRRTL